jgi:hypothetical protein
MAGRLVVSTLNNDTGVLATQNGMTGIAKAWVNFDGTLTTPITPRSAFNVGSVTKNGTGDYTINFTTAMPDANYCAAMAGRRAVGSDGWCRTEVFSTTSLQVITDGTVSNSKANWEVVSVAVFSS